MTRNLSMLSRVSCLAIAAVLTAGAAAESFKGTPTVTFGTVNITEGATTTDLEVTTTTAVIDWTPDDNLVGNFGAIAFQDNGSTATFHSADNFAVLNRINVADPSRLLLMDGAIISMVNNVPGFGSVYFYSSSGFVIGANAVINVGSLVLSASPIAVDGNGNFLVGTSVTFNQAPNPNALINTVAGSQINASGLGSYVALVAPQITHHGTIRTDTAAALVAAEAVTINFSPDGLFDIQVTVGTDAATGIHVEGGTITRNFFPDGAGNHYAYLVAVAKNDAVTMLINSGGSIGFDTATSAAVEDNVVVLAGGYDVSGGQSLGNSGTSTVELTIDQANFSTDTAATITGGADITTSTGNTSWLFGSSLTLTAGDDSFIQAINGNTLSITGSLDANVDRFGTTGKFLRLAAYGSSNLIIGGDVTLSANTFGSGATGDGQTAGSATGGTVIVQTGSGSTIDIGGALDIGANGFGGGNAWSNGAGGAGTGGLAQILANGGNSSINVGGTTNVAAEGQGGSNFECSVCGITGGTGTGGRIDVNGAVGNNNDLNLDSDVTLSAAGFGGSGDAGGGNGIGGQAYLGAADGGTTTVLGDTMVDASGFGGYGYNALGGTGDGGRAFISTFGTAGNLIDLIGDVFVSADGQGGEAGDFGSGGQGGTGIGGQAGVVAMLGTIHAHNNLNIRTQSLGGHILFGSGSGGHGLAALSGPNLTDAFVFSGAGTVQVGGLTILNAGAVGGDGLEGGNGGNATAGSATIHAANSDDGTSIIQLGTVIGLADAQGGAGGAGQGGTNGGDGGAGGSATAGRVTVTAAAGSGELGAGATLVSASATGGIGGSGGNGDGGNGGNAGDGGSAMAGTTTVGAESGDQAFAQGANNGTATYTTILAFASATGGDGGDGGFGTLNGIGGNGGDAFGGSSALLVRGSLVTVGDVQLDASAFGGNGGLSPTAPTGDGGDATAGSVDVLVTNRVTLPGQRGTLFAGNISGAATANGGIGGLGNGLSLSIGGNLFAVLNSNATIASVSLVTSAAAFDGNNPLASSSPIEVQNGIVNISGQFVFQTPGEVSMWADGGTLNTDQIIVDADNFIHDEFRLVPASLGTFSANGIFLTTGQDLIIDAHLISSGNLGLFAPGLIDIEDATSVNADMTIGAGSTIDAGDLNAATDIDLDAGGSILFGNVVADSLDFDSGGAVTGGDIVAGTNAGGSAEGAVILGDISVGIQLTGGPTDEGFAVGVSSATSISVGNVEADEAIGFATLGPLTTGDLNAGTNVMTLVGGNISIQAITTPGNGRIYLADVSMFLDNGGPDDFDPAAVFASDPVATGGSISINEPVSTGRFQAAAGTSLTAGAINAQQIEATTGGLASINGIWSAPFVELWSDDIAIGANGGIDGGAQGIIRLVSTNATQALIGDGLTGTGYALSNAEFGRISAGNVEVAARGDASAAIDMLIGDLSITGPLVGSTIEDPLGALVFATGDPETQVAGGVIRIVGDLVATGFSPDNAIEFYTGRFELDAATELLEIRGPGTELSGELFIDADRIHVASGTILDQLATNPQYAGYQDDLNAPAAVQRLDGVIRAGGVEVLSNGPLAVLVQNTGTAATPAGFLTFGDEPLFSQAEPPPAPIELIVNGQLMTPGGLLTGADVRDFLIDETNVSFFTANSTINGCQLSGPCGFFSDDPGFTPTPGIQDEITLITDEPLPPPEFGNEDFIDDNDEETEDAATSPIEPPLPLFDTSELGEADGTVPQEVGTPMRSSPGLTEPGDVDDPVSGGGNPALQEGGGSDRPGDGSLPPPPPPTGEQEKQP